MKLNFLDIQYKSRKINNICFYMWYDVCYYTTDKLRSAIRHDIRDLVNEQITDEFTDMIVAHINNSTHIEFYAHFN